MEGSQSDEIISVEIITEETEVLESWDLIQQEKPADGVVVAEGALVYNVEIAEGVEKKQTEPQEQESAQEPQSLSAQDHSYPFSSNTVTEGMETCSYCGVWISSKRIQGHISNQHKKGGKQWKCNYCENTSVHHIVIQQHLSKYHPGLPAVIVFSPAETTIDDAENVVVSPASSIEINTHLKDQQTLETNNHPKNQKTLEKNDHYKNQQTLERNNHIKNQQSSQQPKTSKSPVIAVRSKSVLPRRIVDNLSVKKKKIILSSSNPELMSLTQNLTKCPVCSTLISVKMVKKHLKNKHPSCLLYKTDQPSNQASVIQPNPSVTPVRELSSNVEAHQYQELRTVNLHKQNSSASLNTYRTSKVPSKSDSPSAKVLPEKAANAIEDHLLRTNEQSVDDANRRVCNQKISKSHKICGKCGFLYVKLKYHKPVCAGIKSLE